MTVTERAGEMLIAILDATDAAEEECIRLDLSTVRAGLRVDRELLGDEAVEFEGKKVLILDPYTAETVARHVLDCEEGRFVLLGMEEETMNVWGTPD
jgi:hypothetical protein